MQMLSTEISTIMEGGENMAFSYELSYKAGKYRDCLKELEQFTHNFRFRYLILMNKALLLLRLGVLNMNDYNRLLEKIYHQSVQKDGNNVEERLVEHEILVFNLAISCFHIGQLERALQLLSGLVEKPGLAFSFNVWTRAALLNAEILLRLRCPTRASVVLQKLSDYLLDNGGKYPYQSEVQKVKSLIEELRIRVSFEDRRKVSTAGTVSAASSWRRLMLKARENYEKSLPEAAIESFGQARLSYGRKLRQDPINADAVLMTNNSSCLEWQRKNFPAARTEMERTVEMLERSSSLPVSNCIVPKRRLMYNLAVTMLHAGNASAAFSGFVDLIPFYWRNAVLWLRLAECCAAGNVRICCSHSDLQFSTGSTIGWFVRSDSHLSSNSTAEKNLTMSYRCAVQFLKNALYLCDTDRPEWSKLLYREYFVQAVQTECTFELSKPTEILKIKCASLCLLTYLSLITGNNQAAYDTALMLNEISSLSSMQFILNVLYISAATFRKGEVQRAMRCLNVMFNTINLFNWLNYRTDGHQVCECLKRLVKHNMCQLALENGNLEEACQQLCQIPLMQCSLPSIYHLLSLYVHVKRRRQANGFNNTRREYFAL
ncbi:CCR4-NOT transcription complex subunit 10-B [Trichinella pseudospiralis]|uniref:CCR4-NOT transcription complex subunit 10 n=2 Tax=Trichinella pseudospiralis TaxID=6337 RepID=A0A0V1J208_TRIPS|nr:CCR4-NOT transcription complex subunit 10-B [Trichinella pseudospiralis]KRZ29028.1 CCR4-NOT transcription complex subunit 10-B [Trichinella pseudospiralis]